MKHRDNAAEVLLLYHNLGLGVALISDGSTVKEIRRHLFRYRRIAL